MPVPGFGLLVVNSYLIKSQQPILVDSGMPIVKDEFLESLWSLIDPQDLRWIFLTHDDGDHTGAIDEVMAASPQAKVVTQFLGLTRLETRHHVDPNRFIIVNPGQSFDVVDREITVLRPPVFESPSTSAYFDLKTEMLFSADAFGAIIPQLAEEVGDVPASAYAEGFQIFNRLNHPWVALVDQNKFNVALEEIRKLEPKINWSCHSPLARGRTGSHLKAMAQIPALDGPMPLPDQAALEAMLKQIQGGGSH